MKKLTQELKKHLKNKNIIDIFLFGSFLKDKFEPNDIDIMVFFKNKDIPDVNNAIYDIKKSIKSEKLHIEPLFIEDFLSQKIFGSIIHEGYSIKKQRKIADILGYHPKILFTFSLKNLNNLEKVRFSQALYGRKNNGILQLSHGIPLGKGAIMFPVNNEHLIKEAFAKFRVPYKSFRAFVNN